MQFVLTLVTFLVVDGIWIYFVANPLYHKNLPASFLASPVRAVCALLFYVLFSFALWFLFIKRAQTLSLSALTDVFIFGLTAYATYALTNLAIIQEWNWRVTLPDLLWGGVLSVIVTAAVLRFWS